MLNASRPFPPRLFILFWLARTMRSDKRNISSEQRQNIRFTYILSRKSIQGNNPANPLNAFGLAGPIVNLQDNGVDFNRSLGHLHLE